MHAEQQTRRCNAEDLGRLGRFIPGPFGSAFHVKNYDFQSPYRYLRGRDIKPFFILDDDSRYVPEADFQRLKDYAVQHDDLMISVVGTLGNVAVCTSYDTPAIFSCKSTLFRSFGANPYYLLAYLNCHQGQLCLLRRQRGAVQTGLNIEDLKTIPIPRFDNEVESEITFSVRFAHKALRDSKEHYTQAQHLIESELGMDKLSFQKPVGYTAQFSELEQSRRLDAEYFDPVASSIVERISTFDHVRLGANCNVGNGFPWNSKKFLEDNSGEPVVRIRNIRPSHIDVEELSSIDPKYARNIGFPKAKEGDVVVGMDGIKYFYASLLEGDCYVNQRVAHLTWHPGAKISPEYATFIINSSIGQAQLLRDMTVATTVGHITNRNIFNLLIPFVSNAFHRKITNLIKQSIDKKQESKRLLYQAKTRVEQLIEEAVRR
jgi:type I restriction enzyme S subunit